MTDATVTTRQGKVRTTHTEPVLMFKGIPYAAPPSGERRFLPPAPAEPWDGVLDANHYGPLAPQPPSPLESALGAGAAPTSEEGCLTLNVWTPAADDARRPVMVWIHGGAFVAGSGATPWYDGTRFAQHGDVVVVTLNYRLGALGFLHLADVGGEHYASSGNAGILDQVQALTWVRDNISAFGGDPGNVTIFGESAGGMSVGTLLGVPAARGLFRRAILQSGASSGVLPRGEAAKLTDELVAELGISGDVMAQLCDLPIDRLMAAQAAVTTRHEGFALRPVVDGTALPERPLDAIAGGATAGVEILLGTTRDEMTLLHLFNPRIAELDEQRVRRRIEAVAGERTDDVITTYARTRGTLSPQELLTAAQTDAVFRVPAVRLAERHSGAGGTTYMYLFTWCTPAFGGSLKSCHALEIPFVFDNLHRPGAVMFTGEGPEQAELATRMHRAWIAFARTGDPSHEGLPPWPAYTTERRATMVFDRECRVEDDPLGEERRAWEGVPEPA